MKPKELETLVSNCLDAFYKRRLRKLSDLKLKDALKKKNPYLFRAIGIVKAQDLVEKLLSAYMSSSDEGIFGDAFFEPLAKEVSRGAVSPSEGVDVSIESEKTYKAIAVKSGPAVFNSSSRKRQNQNFQSLKNRLFKLNKHFDPIVGYCYGKKKARGNTINAEIFRELAGQDFWAELTGDEEFYIKIIDAMKENPVSHRKAFEEEWGKAINRFTRDFICEFCMPAGDIDWRKLLRFNSGNS